MNEVISFKTSKFNVAGEPENPINPIYGKSLLDWLKVTTENKIEITEPDAEDWGWYSELSWKGRNYLIGSVAYFEKGDAPHSEIEWIFQVHKSRTLVEKLFGREKMTTEDECFKYFKSVFENVPEFNGVTVE